MRGAPRREPGAPRAGNGESPGPPQGTPIRGGHSAVTRTDVSPVAIVGAGGWGTALACLAGEKTATRLWALEPEVADEVNALRTNSRYCPGATLP
ncbi:MAG: hypothetical protein FJX74_25940, partial [Armatimonadetes bacterium]|nr:hypothetical protein [Armatimonadota bacterium]